MIMSERQQFFDIHYLLLNLHGIQTENYFNITVTLKKEAQLNIV